MSSWRAWGQLLRISLFPSAAADVACGLVLGYHGRWPHGSAPFLLIAASLCVYHGAMALNDWADREEDAKTRPERPIPSGAISASASLSVGAGLLFGGLAFAMAAGTAATLWIGIIAWMAWIYDTKGRGPWLGPTLLAGCRAGNLAIGIAAAEGDLVYSGGPAWHWLLPVLYGLYVFVVSRLGRMEDAEDDEPLEMRPKRLLILAAALLLTVPCIPNPESGTLALPLRIASFVLCAWAASGLVRAALRPDEWTRGLVMQSMGLALRRLLIFSTASVLLAGTTPAWVCAAACLSGYPVAFYMRKLFPPS